MENATFLWKPYVPLDNFTVIAGVGDLGKSHVTIDIAARASRGELEGDLLGVPVAVVIATAEDAHAQTLKPRLAAAGADMTRIAVVRQDRAFSVPDDVPELSTAIGQKGSRLLIIDPLVAYIPVRLDSHKDQHARNALAPLQALASEHHLAVVAIMHLNKDSEAKALFQRVSSSVGFLNAARSALLVAADPDDDTLRVVAHGKHNLSEPGIARQYRIVGVELDEIDPHTEERIRTSRIEWLGDSLRSVGELLKTSAEKPRDRAKTWLRHQLNDGPLPQRWIEERAERDGLAMATVRRAKEELGVRSDRSGGAGAEGRWEWSLPPDQVPSVPPRAQLVDEPAERCPECGGTVGHTLSCSRSPYRQ
jgi:hypothetical protein